VSELTPAVPENGRQESGLRIPIWLALLVMIAALALAALILSRVAEPLYALLFPHEVPVPAGAKVVEHGKPDKGAEYWVYRTSMSGEEVAQFYEKHGATCLYTPIPLEFDENSQASEAYNGPYGVAQCSGSQHSGGLGVSWQVYIHAGYPDEEGPTIFRLYQMK
jgi:hypothetical protein